MQPFERWLLLRKFLHWHSISQSRGKALRFLRRPIDRWRNFTQQQKLFRENERRARRAIRVCRIQNALELCLTHLATSKIAHAAEVGWWLQTTQSIHVPISNRLDSLLEEVDEAGHEEVLSIEAPHRQNSTKPSPKQLYIQGKWVTLSEHDLSGLMTLKQFHWLLSQFGAYEKRNDTIQLVISSPASQPAASPMDMLKHHLIQVLSIDTSNVEDPLSLPEVHILELIQLADEIESTVKEYDRANFTPKKKILQQHYISTGSEERPATASYFGPEHTNAEQNIADDNMSKTSNLTGLDAWTNDELFDVEEEQSFAKYLAEISNVGNGVSKDATGQGSSLVDTVASAAKSDLSTMKLDVDKSLLDARSSQIHLANYKEFIEKKKKQRIQCLRDIQSHCCTCRGPHVSKPPFCTAGKDYRREPTHPQHQGSKCIFLKKKRAELRWLDETIGNYSKNNKRFEKEIEKRQAETQNRKENMKEALANSLRLMELASDNFDL